jgi:hypothetical protein
MTVNNKNVSSTRLQQTYASTKINYSQKVIFAQIDSDPTTELQMPPDGWTQRVIMRPPDKLTVLHWYHEGAQPPP